MKILQIRFKNLNSLVGEWTIDLENPAYTDNGIFAITGPTGAGKSTVLDALCLALYGRTPRLNRVNKSGNEILSRRMGDCFAEVTFETAKGKYRCVWSQNRARKKADGELQMPRQEISDATTGKVLEGKIRGVAEKIEEVTGMDFDRFTRSMLLAQGGFSAFLQAAPDDRAPILEQITGTEIYSNISMAVHEQYVAEKNCLEDLQKELAGLPLLTAEQEAAYKESLVASEVQEKSIGSDIERCQAEIAWITGIERLQKDLAALEMEQENLVGEEIAFLPEQERLKNAEKALELSAVYASLRSMRKEQENDIKNRETETARLPVFESNVEQRKEQLVTLVSSLTKKKEEQQLSLPIIRATQTLDLKIAERRPPLALLQKSVLAGQEEVQKLSEKTMKDVVELGKLSLALEKIAGDMAAAKADECLVEELTGLQQRISFIQTVNRQRLDKKKEAAAAENAVTNKAQQLMEIQTEQIKHHQEVDALALAREKGEMRIQDLLGVSSLSRLREVRDVFASSENDLARAMEAAKTAHLSGERRFLFEDKKNKALDEQKVKTERLTAKEALSLNLEKEMDLAQKQADRLRSMADLEEQRRLLEDGEACPLCGSISHPYAEGNVPLMDAVAEQLVRCKADYKENEKNISQLYVQLAKAEKDIESAETQRLEQENILQTVSAVVAETRQKIVGALPEQSLLPDETDASGIGTDLPEAFAQLRSTDLFTAAHLASETMAPLFEQLQRYAQAEKLKLKERIMAVERAEKETESLRQSMEKMQALLVRRDIDVQAMTHQLETERQTLERVQKEAVQFAVQVTADLALLENDVSVYMDSHENIAPLTVAALPTLLESLNQRRVRWLSWQTEKKQTDQKMEKMTAQNESDMRLLTLRQAETANLEVQWRLSQADLDALLAERKSLYGEKDPQKEEERLAGEWDALFAAQEVGQRLLAEGEQVLTKQQSQVAALTRDIAERQEPLLLAEEAFVQQLQEKAFSDEETYRQACLLEGERKGLQQKAQALLNKASALAAKRSSTETLLAGEEEKKLTSESKENLAVLVAEGMDTLRQLRQDMGGVHQKLLDNAATRQKVGERLQQIDIQKAELERWHLLHDLIGSADGKKFRNFAQGLTFEMMVHHANRQLQKLSDRYLLTRDAAQPLELNIIDNYQAGEERSTKNLSGGESFIVSLSLALGLSNMASKNVRVDSLFLDEGFGTLDEEALNTALETLSSLHQEGKLIGVISHVSALKERIMTQIQVIPQAGGRSILRGPGVGSVVLDKA